MPAAGSIHKIGPSVFNGSGTFQLSGVRNVSLNPNIQEFLEYAAGQIDPSYVAIMAAAPEIPLTVFEIATALTKGWPSGIAIPQTTVITALDQFFCQTNENGELVSGANHFKTTISRGLVALGTITAAQGQPATITMTAAASYDGTNEPFIHTDSISLPASILLGEAFTLGPVYINGTELTGVQGWSLDVGMEIEKISAGGSVFPLRLHIKHRRCKLKVRTNRLLALSSFGLHGTAQGATPSNLYLTRLVSGGDRVAPGTATHIKITMNANQGEFWCENFGGGNNEPVVGELNCCPIAGSAAVLAVSTTSTIP